MSILACGPPALEILNLSCAPTGEPPLRGITLSVSAGEFIALIGPNGSGTETLCRCLAGLRASISGRILIHGAPMEPQAWGPARGGLYVMLRGRHTFNEMTVHDNLLASPGAWTKKRSTRLDEVFRLFPVLAERRHQVAGNLSGGERQMLAIGRALLANPRVLLIEDPFMGLSPKVMGEVMEAMVSISRRGVAVLTTGEGLRDVPRLVDRTVTISNGRVVEDDVDGM